MAKQILVLNGIHTAGKTTIGEKLEEEGYNVFDEVAQEIIDEEGVGWGLDSCNEFQRSIHEREAARDQQLLENGRRTAVIETWHTGCLAHSEEVADQEVVEEQRQYLEEITGKDDLEVYAVLLDTPPEEVLERSEHFGEGDEEIVEFYSKVRDNHLHLYEELGIDYEVVDNPQGNLDRAYNKVKKIAEEVLT